MAITTIWCLTKSVLFPDYKRPYTTFDTYHFSTMKEVNEKAYSFIEDFLRENKESGWEICAKSYNSLEYQEEGPYNEAYLHRSPLDFELYEVTLSDGKVENQTKVDHYNPKLDEKKCKCSSCIL